MDNEGLKSLSLSMDPMKNFASWFQAAKDSGQIEPTAMTLSTVDKSGNPDSRIVLLKSHQEGGFRFFTNLGSPKAQQVIDKPYASLVFHWTQPEHRQIRIRGPVERLSYEESDEYFQSRPRGSRISALASPQSQKINSREELDQMHKEVEKEYEGKEIPCPENWGGFILKPKKFEFWQEREFRYHDRFLFEVIDGSWKVERLGP